MQIGHINKENLKDVKGCRTMSFRAKAWPWVHSWLLEMGCHDKILRQRQKMTIRMANVSEKKTFGMIQASGLER